jgi:hypothetical protein
MSAPEPIGTITLTDGTNQYTFNVWPRAQRFNSIGVIYVMAKKNDSGKYSIIYIGQTGDASSRPFNHHRKDCFDRHGADHVFLRTESNEKTRLGIETALIKHYDPPCNKQ